MSEFPMCGLVPQKTIPPFFGYKDWRSVKKMIDTGILKNFPEPIINNPTCKVYQAEKVRECYKLSFGE